MFCSRGGDLSDGIAASTQLVAEGFVGLMSVIARR